jgi:hypothetical protein
MDNRLGGDHFGIEQGLARQGAMKGAAMPVSPVHHRCNRKSERIVMSNFL